MSIRSVWKVVFCASALAMLACGSSTEDALFHSSGKPDAGRSHAGSDARDAGANGGAGHGGATSTGGSDSGGSPGNGGKGNGGADAGSDSSLGEGGATSTGGNSNDGATESGSGAGGESDGGGAGNGGTAGTSGAAGSGGAAGTGGIAGNGGAGGKGGTAGNGGVAGKGGAAGSGGKGGNGGKSAEAGVIRCGSTTCTIDAGQKCCINMNTGSERCAAACTSGTEATLNCDGPEDCPGTQCSYNLSSSTDFYTSCGTGGAAIAPVECIVPDQCGGGLSCCDSASNNGTSCAANCEYRALCADDKDCAGDEKCVPAKTSGRYLGAHECRLASLQSQEGAVRCGDQTCAKGMHCCEGGSTLACTASACAVTSTAITCDGVEDCAYACCGPGGILAGLQGCTTTCSPGSTRFECTGAAQCSSTKSCCVQNGIAHCQTSCTGDVMCWTDADCPQNQTCTPVAAYGAFRACR